MQSLKGTFIKPPLREVWRAFYDKKLFQDRMEKFDEVQIYFLHQLVWFNSGLDMLPADHNLYFK